MTNKPYADAGVPQVPGTTPALFDFDRTKGRLNRLIQGHGAEVQAIEIRRRARAKDESRDELLSNKTITADQHYIPRRIIDQNVTRDVPAYVAYVEQAPNVMTFVPLFDNTLVVKPLEEFFTRAVRYPGWNVSWICGADCTLLHGGSVLELCQDTPEEPTLAGLKLEYVPREDFIIDKEAAGSIQRQELIGRRYQYYAWQLEEGRDSEKFNKDVVNRLLEGATEADRTRLYSAYRWFERRKGVIYTFWTVDGGSSWLQEPTALNLGKIDMSSGEPIAAPINFFPFFWSQLTYTEDTRLLYVKGRGSKDLADQDALTQLWTAVVNGTTLAASMSGSFENDPINPSSQENQSFKPNSIYSKAVRFHQAQYPDPMILQVASALSVTNSASAGQIDYAANNRVDSRKTAAEIKSATAQKSNLSATQLVPFATCVREAYTRFWEIFQSRILAKVIPVPENIFALADNIFMLTPAGDIEVLKRDEMLSNLQAIYSLVAATPIGNKVLIRIMEIMFPKEAATWAPLLETPDQTALAAQLLSVLEGFPTDGLTPEMQTQLTSIIENARAAIGTGAQPPNAVAPAPDDDP